jgi:hypothetical protein
MVISLVCGILSARLVIGEAGVSNYALMSLLIALPSLVAFSDLGAGAVVINSVATSPDIRTDLPLRRQTTTVARVILMFAASAAVIDLVLFLSGGWSLVLGSTGSVRNATLAAFVCVLIYCVTVSLGLWQRILLGLGRNPIVILLQGLISPLSLLIVWILLSVGDPTLRSFLALGTFLATLAVAVTGTIVADRLSSPLLRVTAAEVFHPRRYPGVRVMDVGWPMFAQLLAGPLSLTLPRYILAQSASHTQLAEYALAGQVFFALQALIGAHQGASRGADHPRPLLHLGDLRGLGDRCDPDRHPDRAVVLRDRLSRRGRGQRAGDPVIRAHDDLSGAAVPARHVHHGSTGNPLPGRAGARDGRVDGRVDHPDGADPRGGRTPADERGLRDRVPTHSIHGIYPTSP